MVIPIRKIGSGDHLGIYRPILSLVSYVVFWSISLLIIIIIIIYLYQTQQRSIITRKTKTHKQIYQAQHKA